MPHGHELYDWDRNARVQDFINRDIQANKFPGIQYLIVDANSTLFSYNGGLAEYRAGESWRRRRQ